MPGTTDQFLLPMGFELTAVFLFAVTGALLAIDQQYDVVGVLSSRCSRPAFF